MVYNYNTYYVFYLHMYILNHIIYIVNIKFQIFY